MKAPYFIGIDVGTQGARVVLIDVTGNVLGSEEQSFPLSNQSREEQSPQQWWNDCLLCLQRLLHQAKNRVDLHDIHAVSVTATSGTVIPIDHNNEPLHPAIMYSDNRSAAEAKACRQAAIAANSSGYTAFNASSGLPKMLWFIHHFPYQIPRLSKFIHAADFIIGRLCDRYDVTDYTNALKSGYDVKNNLWPSYIWEILPIRQQWLPSVVGSGNTISPIAATLADSLGLSRTVHVVAGMTDGCAAQIASGAVNVGDWNTTIGTTLVVKGVTTREINDPEGRLYCHRHPEGYWMPGGASNTGADWISSDFGDGLPELNREAARLIPTPHLAWPLKQHGERFPFIAPEATGFYPEGLSRSELFTAGLEGVAYIERYAFEVIQQLSGEKVSAVYTAGGGSNSDVWLTIRSNVLRLPIYKMKYVTGAVGAAILAASKTYFSSVIQATRALTQIEKEVYPQQTLADQYQNNYRRFVDTLIQKGYIPQTQYA
jgi:D-ribulokinase